MSSTAKSSTPNAAPQPETGEAESDSGRFFFSQHAGKLADKARANPKTAVAAGAALVAGAVAAAAIPLVRARSKPTGSNRGRAKKTS